MPCSVGILAPTLSPCKSCEPLQDNRKIGAICTASVQHCTHVRAAGGAEHIEAGLRLLVSVFRRSLQSRVIAGVETTLLTGDDAIG